MPLYYRREDIHHRVLVKRVYGDEVKMAQESRSDVVPAATRGTHGSDDDNIHKTQDARVLSAR